VIKVVIVKKIKVVRPKIKLKVEMAKVLMMTVKDQKTKK
jgi:hypothetical protein